MGGNFVSSSGVKRSHLVWYTRLDLLYGFALIPTVTRLRRFSFTGHTLDPPVRSVESMRQLAGQLADAERVAREAEATLTSRADGVIRPLTVHENSMLSDMHGRHHNYLRISLTER